MNAEDWVQQAQDAVEDGAYDRAQACALLAIAIRLGALVNRAQ